MFWMHSCCHKNCFIHPKEWMITNLLKVWRYSSYYFSLLFVKQALFQSLRIIEMREKYVKTTFSSQNFFLLILLDTVTCLLLIFWPKKAETKSIAHEQIYNNAHPKNLCSHANCMQVFHKCFSRYQGGEEYILFWYSL